MQVPKVRWSDVGGLEGVKQGLKEAVQWPHLHPDALTRLGAQPPRGTLTLTLLIITLTFYLLWVHQRHCASCAKPEFLTAQGACVEGLDHCFVALQRLAATFVACMLPMIPVL